MNDEIRTTIEWALLFSRDTLKESAALFITDGEPVIAAEIARHNAALVWLGEQGKEGQGGKHDDSVGAAPQ